MAKLKGGKTIRSGKRVMLSEVEQAELLRTIIESAATKKVTVELEKNFYIVVDIPVLSEEHISSMVHERLKLDGSIPF